MGDAATNKLERLDIRSRLLDKYREMSRKANIKPMGARAFFKAFSDEAGFADGEEKTCCCGSCVDGWLAMTMMREFAESADLGLQQGTQQQMVADIQAAKKFFDGPYRWKHLQRSSSVATHCMQHALTSTSTVKNANAHRAHTTQLQDFNCSCDHSHVASCEECNQLHRLHKQFSAHVDEAIAKRLSEVEFVVGEDAKAMAMQHAQNTGEVWREHITMLHDEASRWVGHIVRKHAASRAPPELKSQLKLGEVFLTINYKCKPPSRKNREPQSENFGKRGEVIIWSISIVLKGDHGRIPAATRGGAARL